jgi:muramoyltetrapeptide carboxypeptidase
VYTPDLRTTHKSKAVKPPALAPGDEVRLISPASSAQPEAISLGIAELERLGYRVRRTSPEMKPDGYTAGPLLRRAAELESALRDPATRAMICIRGGYGSAMLLDRLQSFKLTRPKLLIGFSDVTMLQAFVWQRARWTSVYGPMAAAGFDRGEGQNEGYDRESFLSAVSGAQPSWSIDLGGEPLAPGKAIGTLLGGCLTLIQTTLGTPWSLDTRGSILVLEDRAVKPYQLDRALLHLAQAGKFRGIKGVVLGDFPESGTPLGSNVSVRDVCQRVFGSMGIPAIFGAAIGHTRRPMLTIPLGVKARLTASGEGKLEILEPVVAKTK